MLAGEHAFKLIGGDAVLESLKKLGRLLFSVGIILRCCQFLENIGILPVGKTGLPTDNRGLQRTFFLLNGPGAFNIAPEFRGKGFVFKLLQPYFLGV